MRRPSLIEIEFFGLAALTVFSIGASVVQAVRSLLGNP